MSIKYHLYVFLLAALTLVSCNVPDDVSQAQQTVALADSLRVRQASASADNLSAPDSAALALAYHTLAKNAFRRWHYADDYTRACYHYGRQLRQSGNQVAAMQCFIDGTHSRSRDHLTKERIYNNIGDMCHIAGEFQLSYEMFKKGAEEVKNTKDSIPYYYTLYSMALEMAELKQTEQTHLIINEILQNCADYDVITYTWIPLSILYRCTQEYDSAIYAVNQLHSRGNHAAIGYVIKAQSFWFLQQYDSALCYAHHVMSLPDAADHDRYNMLYILAYNDSTISSDSIRQLTELRTDIDIKKIDPLIVNLTQAVGILRQDIQNEKHKPVVYTLSILFIILIIFIFVILKRKHHKVVVKERQLLETTKIEQAKQTQLLALLQELLSSNDELLQQSAQLKQQQSVYIQSSKSIIEQNCRKILKSSDWKRELHWKDYNRFCEITNQLFFFLTDKLKVQRLNETEIRLCILVLLDGFELKKIASELNYGESGISTLKYRVAKKLNTSSSDLRQFLIDLAIFYDISNAEK